MIILFFLIGSVFADFGEITLQSIDRYLPSNPVVLEAGAAFGKDTLKMSEMWPDGKIYGFEPVLTSLVQARRRVAHCSNVALYPYALGKTLGSANFYVSSGAYSLQNSSSLFPPKDHLKVFPMVTFKDNDVVEVPVITIDDWARAAGVDHIDFMWLDLQGAEYEALCGAQELLKTVKAIFMEVNYIELYEGCMLFKDLRPWMEAQGFKLVAVEHHRTKKFGNALFVRD